MRQAAMIVKLPLGAFGYISTLRTWVNSQDEIKPF
jgi:hypothetical protein